MDTKLLARTFSFLSILLAIYGQTAEAFQLEAAIYYGDSLVDIGKPFKITCIIPITDPIYWIKDGEPITRHNLRHGRDEHSYILSESAIEGEKHKIEAHISVRHALKVHEGRYQCNKLHSSYHLLQIRATKWEQELKKLQQQQQIHEVHISESGSRFGGSGDLDNNAVDHYELPTKAIYKNVSDIITSSKINENNDRTEIYTSEWQPVTMTVTTSQIFALPTQSTTTNEILMQQQKHHRVHHHHHQHKLPYLNITNYDDTSRMVDTEKPYDTISGFTIPGFINTQYNRYSTIEPWHNFTIYFAATPPHIPPPRTVSSESGDMSQEGNYNGVSVPSGSSKQPQDIHYATTGEGLEVDTNSQYSLDKTDTIPFQSSSELLSKVTNIYQNSPFQHYNHQYPKSQSIEGQQQQRKQYPDLITMTSVGVTGVMATSKPLFASSSNIFELLSPVHRYSTTLTSIPYLNHNNTNMMTNTNDRNINALLTQLNNKSEPEFLVPNYDNAEHELKVYEIRSPLVLSCNITKEGSYELTWEKNGTEVSKVKELEGRYRILDIERKFIIDKTDFDDDGLYSCVADNKKRDFNVVALVAVRVPSNVNVVEGEKLSIDCTVVGTDPQLSWSFGNMTITNTTGRYILKPNDKNVQNAILTIDNISLNDRGEFTCIGQNAANFYANFKEASDVSFVRIKGKFAALWPFLGICAEVLILCAIILIYEKRRNKNELEDSDTDPQEQKKKWRNYD